MSNPRTAKWLSRFIGFIPVSIIALLMSVQGADQLQSGIFMEVLPLLIVLGIGVLGYVISWISPPIGGLIEILASISMLVSFYIMYGGLEGDAILMYPIPFVTSGILALYCWRYEKKYHIR